MRMVEAIRVAESHGRNPASEASGGNPARPFHKTYRRVYIVDDCPINGVLREVTVANLGPRFNLPKGLWPALISRIKGKSGPLPVGLCPTMDEETATMIDALADALRVEIDARKAYLAQNGPMKPGRPSRRERKEMAMPPTEDNKFSVDARTCWFELSRSGGGERVVLNEAFERGLDKILREVGIPGRTADLIAMQVLARALHPGSELGTLKWLKENSALPSRMGIDPESLNVMQLHRAADALFEHWEAVEPRYLQSFVGLRTQKWLLLKADLTNTFFEGGSKGIDKARRGRSKEKRSDCKLVTLALGIDGQNYITSSEVLPGNVSEPSALEGIIARARLMPGDMVLMDKGIATRANLDWLGENGYQYLAASRETKRVFDPSLASACETASGGALDVYREDGASGSPSMIRVRSERRAQKDLDREGMRFGRFVGAIGALNHGLQNLEEQAARRRKKEEEEEEERAARGNEKKGQAAKGKKGRKPPLNQERATVAYVRERIGRIKQTYGCARHFEITVVPRADRPDIAARVEWTKKVLPGSKADLPGVYSLETNCPGLGAAEGARLYHGLSDVEGVFRYLKSDLGLRPLYHSKGDRVDAHIYISCMAYQLVNSIMIKLKENGIPDSWRTVRERLAASSQIMAIAKHNSHLWDVVMEGLSRPVEAAEKYYKALGLDARPKTCKVRIVKPPLGSRPLSPAF